MFKLKYSGQCKSCIKTLKPSNSAINFSNPTLSVKLCLQREIIKSNQKILEIGPGNLRNGIFILKNVDNINFCVFDLQCTVSRFPSKYETYRKLGGKIKKEISDKQRFDIIICTFVLETICPSSNRDNVLRSLQRILKEDGKMIVSIRGYKGVKGTKYKKCPFGDGYISPLHTFIRPHSISEVQKFFKNNGFTNIQMLQNYRVDKPQNIHLIAN